MPHFRKLGEAEIAAHQPAPSARAQIAREYDAYVAGFTAGDYGQAELAGHERRSVVRQRLHAAARRRGLIGVNPTSVSPASTERRAGLIDEEMGSVIRAGIALMRVGILRLVAGMLGLALVRCLR